MNIRSAPHYTHFTPVQCIGRADLEDVSAVLTPGTVPPHAPLFTSAISAGFPSPADDFLENQLDVQEYLVEHPAATFFMRVEGNACAAEGVYANDVLVVDRSRTPKANALVVVVQDGELQLQRWKKKDAAYHDADAAHDARTVQAQNNVATHVACELWGVVTGVIRKL